MSSQCNAQPVGRLQQIEIAAQRAARDDGGVVRNVDIAVNEPSPFPATRRGWNNASIQILITLSIVGALGVLLIADSVLS
jgi:hypothetical protein